MKLFRTDDAYRTLMAKEMMMIKSIVLAVMLVLGATAFSPSSRAQSLAKPERLLKEVVQGMPRGDKQEVRVLTANFKPGDRTVFHTHRFPVAVYVLEGAFTLEMEGRKPTILRTGEAMVEPPHVKMTGYNRSSTEPLRVVIFYVSDPDTPFLDPISR